ncbi:MAG: hypothetical protein QOG39_1065 [Acidimicrobiaceae bacterium]|jgi:EmrB/QacA subfamily drug resistance transporter
MTATHVPPVSFSHRQILLVLAGIGTGMALAGLDQTIVDTALPTIVGELGGINHLSWVVTAYLLTSTVSTPLYGKLSDLYGRRRLFQAAIVIFLIGSALCGLAQTMLQLILCRGLQGIGGGGLIAMAFAIIGDVVPPRERGRYTGYLAGVFAVTSVVGPLTGGLFVDHIGWRWIFYVNVPLGIGSLVVTSKLLDLPFITRRRRIDFEGAALLVGSVACLLLALVWGGDQYPWGSATIVGLGVTGAALLVVFLFWESRRAEDPIIPLRLFRNNVVALCSLMVFLLGLAQYGGIVFLPIFLQIVVGRSATNSGLLLLPLMCGLIVSSVWSGRLIVRSGRYKRYPIIGFGVVTTVLVLFSTMSRATPAWTTTAYMFLFGIGMGMVSPVLVTAVQNAVDRTDLGVATSVNTFFRNLGGAFGVGIFGAILNNRLTSELAHHFASGASAVGDPKSLLQSPAAIKALPAATRTGVVESVQSSVTTVFLWAAPLAFTAFVAAWFLRELPLREHSSLSAGEAADGAVDALTETAMLH